MELPGHVTDGTLQQEDALTVQRVHDLHLLVLGETVHRDGVLPQHAGDDAGGGAGDGGGEMLLHLFAGVALVGDETGTAGDGGADGAAAQVHDALAQFLVAAGVEVDAQQARQFTVFILDEHGVGAHLFAAGGHGLEIQHIVLLLIQLACHKGQHTVAEGGADVAPGELPVGNGDDAVGVAGELVEGDFIVGAQNMAQIIHQQGVMPNQFLFHRCHLAFRCGSMPV